jgi:hypothetical protein
MRYTDAGWEGNAAAQGRNSSSRRLEDLKLRYFELLLVLSGWKGPCVFVNASAARVRARGGAGIYELMRLY